MDPAEFEKLYEQLRRSLFAYAASRLAPQEALDVVHSTFEVVWRKRAAAPENPVEWPAWCFGIARNIVLQEAQRSQRKHHDRRFLEDVSEAVDVPANDDISESVTDAEYGREIWSSLSAQERELIVVALTTQASAAEKAALLGTSYSAYTTRMSRLRAKLTRMLSTSDDASTKVTTHD